MRKRLVSALVVLALLAALFPACGMPQKGQGSGSGAFVDYEYGQELNIIDDNYRNYYEIFVYSFYDSDGDGIGDLQGVIQKLDYIEEMGFNGIWLMPVMPSPTYHKYDVTDYENIDPVYGDLEDFRQLTEACHERGIRLVIDLVMNHSSSEHPWFTQACDYLISLPEGQEPDLSVCPYVDYYHFTTEQVNSTYYGVPGVNWWYEGAFWSEMPDLNLESAALRAEFEKIADFWMELGVDGFRMDAALHFEENDTTANNEILHWLYSYCLEKNPDFYMVSEVWANVATIADYYGSTTPSMFNFDAGSAEGKLISAARNGKMSSLVQAMLDYQEDFLAENPEYIDAPFLTNHDMGRVANSVVSDPDKLKMAAGLLMMMNGSPFVYYGEEIGMKSSGTEDENKRLPMYWSDTDTTGITKGPAGSVGEPLSSLPSWEAQREDTDSLLNYYERALRLRNENPEIARGRVEKVESLCEGAQAAITKNYMDNTVGIVYNVSGEEITISLEGTVLSDMSIRGYLTLHQEKVSLEGQNLVLPPGSICILK
ncbi:MAG: alpha-amylase family glycosyl hydrolase [Muribaculaceae bacterium]|nr:alpha-amylase family glycosyl hydrolase [Roseburia sp.]MCM1431416.1 alpha-amylase family glycosyl hydrolase [Muribaculaceae bacterium]MCM1491858.1 alpha-amylase family glycosyl hydrolase [Muribaculaceae bacterium]